MWVRPSKPHGFTVIEVLIVLAIAGIILAIIFMAVPALRKNSRNYHRKAAVDYVASQMESYYSTTGHYPLYGTSSAKDDRTSFVSGLKSDGVAATFDIRYTDSNGSHEFPFSGSGAPANLDDSLNQVNIQPGHRCNRTAGVKAGDTDYPLKSSELGDFSYQHYVVWALLERNAIYCIDNSQ